MKTLLSGIVGSTAYGLNTPTSDIDYAGVFVRPTADFLGLHPATRERASEVTHSAEGDSTFHEVGKAMFLMLGCNPTASEILWLDSHTTMTDFGVELISLRSHFLSARLVRNAFHGFAKSQFYRLLERGRFAGSLETRREKHARHTMRVLWQGYQLYTTGILPIRVDDPEPYFEFGRRIKADPEALAARTLLTEYEIKFDEARTVLPDAPSEAPLEDFLQRVRRAHLDNAEAA